MQDNFPKSLFKQLESIPGLEDLISASRHLQYLQTLFNQIEPALAEHCMIAKLDKDLLVLAVEDSAWAARIRYAAPRILANLKKAKEFKEVKKVECRILPKKVAQTKQRTPDKVSSRNVELVEEAAATVRDNGLKNALLRLAKTFKQRLP